MRRALAILKYAPAVLCGLLVVAWVVSVTIPIGYRGSIGKDGYFALVVLRCGNVDVWIDPHPFGTGFDSGFSEPDTKIGPGYRWTGWKGSLDIDIQRVSTRIGIPLLPLIVAAIPFAFMPFVRFPLWSYFAWTAHVAVELAYYSDNTLVAYIFERGGWLLLALFVLVFLICHSKAS